MINTTRRQTLKILAGTTAAIAAPSVLMSSAQAACGHDAMATAGKHGSAIPLATGDGEIDISLVTGAQPVVRFTNNTDKVVIIRHVYPGIVHAGNQTFDINSLFEASATAVSPGKSRIKAISPTVSTQAERDVPIGQGTGTPLRIATLTGTDGSETLINSTRTFFV